MNIVKELVENAIDANATRISVQIENGGLDRIIVQDDGEGMTSHDLRLAFEQHTTSKLLNDEITNVLTLGFRGEALASIAAVTRVESASRSSEEKQGNALIIEGGHLLSQNERSMKKGTRMEISAIFFNTPARRKFLKKPATERKRIIDLLIHFALSYPRVHFILEEKDKTQYKTRIESPMRKSSLAVIYDVLGHEIAGELVPVKGKTSNWKIDGYISKPNLTRKDRSLQYLSINGRTVRHAELQSAIESAYGSQLMRSSHPIIILNISGSSDAVDFNIHPQKSEIRFRTTDLIIDELSELIQISLESGSELPILRKSKLDNISKTSKTSIEGQDYEEIDLEPVYEETSRQKSVPRRTQETLTKDDVVAFQGRKVLGHIMNKFGLIDNDGDELWLVDIHAADERVKFEKFEKGTARQALSQQFLEPMVMEFTPSDKQILLDHQPALDKFGLKISTSTGNQLLIHSCPVYYDQIITPDLTKRLLEDVAIFLADFNSDSELSDSPFSRIEYGIVARLACHGSIRSGVPVSNQVISKVIQELLQCKNPWTCAHGRPTILRISKSRLEGWFNR
jgi:DNA mismatch repair protein MutL